MYHPLIKAQENGLSVGGIKVDLTHPSEMVSEEEGPYKASWDRKRHEQFSLQMNNLLKDLTGSSEK